MSIDDIYEIYDSAERKWLVDNCDIVRKIMSDRDTQQPVQCAPSLEEWGKGFAERQCKRKSEQPVQEPPVHELSDEMFRVALFYAATQVENASARQLFLEAEERLKKCKEEQSVEDTDCPSCVYNKLRKQCLTLGLDPSAMLRKPEREAVTLSEDQKAEALNIMSQAIRDNLDESTCMPSPEEDSVVALAALLERFVITRQAPTFGGNHETNSR